jgi:hypothetical protein
MPTGPPLFHFSIKPLFFDSRRIQFALSLPRPTWHPPRPALPARRYVLTFDQTSDAPCLVTLAQHGDPLLPVGFYVINKDGETTGKGAFMHAPEVACQVKLLPQFQPYVLFSGLCMCMCVCAGVCLAGWCALVRALLVSSCVFRFTISPCSYIRATSVRTYCTHYLCVSICLPITRLLLFSSQVPDRAVHIRTKANRPFHSRRFLCRSDRAR